MEAMLARGDVAVATARKLETLPDLSAKYSSEQLLILPLDITNSAQITATFQKIKEKFGRLSAVINNGAIGSGGEIEGTPESAAGEMFG